MLVTHVGEGYIVGDTRSRRVVLLVTHGGEVGIRLWQLSIFMLLVISCQKYRKLLLISHESMIDHILIKLLISIAQAFISDLIY